MTETTHQPVIPEYLDLLDAQREAAFAALADLSEDQIWRRPAPKEWCIGEILDHTTRLLRSTMPYVRFVWRWFRWLGERRRGRAYRTHIPDLYRTGHFPMWVGVLWTPRVNPDRPAPLAKLQANIRELHGEIRDFYTDKPEPVLGNLRVFDPYFGFLNLIVTLRLGAYHDQLHYDDVIALAARWKSEGTTDHTEDNP
jgi:hypothetical protein